MKKIISCALILCMLVSFVAMFSSCALVTSYKIKKDPTSSLSDAATNALTEFFGDYGIGEVAKDALKGGSVGLSFSSKTKELSKLGKLDLIGYFEKGKPAALTFSVEDGNETYDATAFFSEKGIVVDSEALFGISGPIGAYFDTFKAKFEDSYLAFGLDPETIEILQNLIDKLQSVFQKNIKENAEDLEEKLTVLLDTLKETVGETTMNGEKHAVISYTVNNETLRAFLEKLPEVIEDPTGELDFDALLSEFDEFDEYYEIDITAKAYINLADNLLTQIVLDMSSEYLRWDEKESLKFTLTFDDDDITLVIRETDSDGEITTESFKIEKEQDGDETTYILSYTDRYKDTITLLTYVYDKDSGEFSITATVNGDSYFANGEITANKKKAVIAISEVGTEGITLDFNLALTFSAKADTPETPDNVKDIIDFTEADFEGLITRIEKSDFAEYLENAFDSLDSIGKPLGVVKTGSD